MIKNREKQCQFIKNRETTMNNNEKERKNNEKQ